MTECVSQRMNKVLIIIHDDKQEENDLLLSELKKKRYKFSV